MRIKRSEILRAIRQEPLKHGNWLHEKEEYKIDDNGFQYKSYTADKTCKVCAVGAVLRQKGIVDDEISDRANDCLMNLGVYVNEEGDELQALKDKQYLVALSVKFEKLAKRLGHGKRTRTRLAEFVKANFPKQFNVKI